MGGAGRLTFVARVEPRPVKGGPPEQLVLELTDAGPGVPAEIRDRLFEPFVTYGKKRGTGLGLSVARRFVEDHGGSLELLPSLPPPAQGARFRLSVPLERRDPESPR
jgi:signal transduction histidine kinase